MEERVRFAPSPTGPLHIGGVRTALFNYLFAKKNKGVFVLRIEDTDQKRKVEASESYIFESLRWVGIEPDESIQNPGKYGPYRQSERNEIYKTYIQELLEKGGAYYAFDTIENLAKKRALKEKEIGGFKYNFANRSSFDNSLNISPEETQKRIKAGENFVIRLKLPPDQEIISKDEIRGAIRVNSSELEDKILMKADGTPTYHLANVIDDYCMKITTVIRGEEWLPSLPIHTFLYEAYGWEKPKFLHLPLILNPSGKGKLSKRDGDRNRYPVFPIAWKNEFKGYREMGFLPSAHLNYIAQLGWSPKVSDEIMSLEEIVQRFNIKDIQKGGAKFDYNKAKWVNQQHILRLPIDELTKLCIDQEPKLSQIFDPETTQNIISLIRERIILLNDIPLLFSIFINSPIAYNEKSIEKIKKSGVEISTIIEKINALISSTNDFDKLKDSIFLLCKTDNIKMGLVMQILRIAIVGDLTGPDIIEIIKVIGKSRTFERITNFKNHI